jgi:pimeloyl-ACP methyl ester carboxylesterase
LRNAAGRLFRYSDTVNINYEKHGDGQRSLVCLHGFGASLETWRDVLPYFQTYTVYLVDLKGFGLSSKPDDNQYRPSDQARIVSAFLDFIDVRHAVLVGNSLGGGVALMTYLTMPSVPARVDRLVLIDAAVYPQPLPFYISLLRVPVLKKVIPHLISADARVRLVLANGFYDNAKVTPDRVRRHGQFLDLPGSLHALIETAHQIIPDDIQSFLGKLKEVNIPTLIIWGEQDRIISPGKAQRLQRDIHDARLVIIPKCGHLPQEEAPTATAEAIRAFLGGN